MSAKEITISDKAAQKVLAHVLKYHQSDCLGVLIGTRSQSQITVTDAVPLFHDRVFTSVLEVAFQMIEQVYPESQILGIYDAPLKYKPGESIPFTSLAINIAEQIKATNEVSETIAVSVRVPAPKESDEKVREVTDEDESLLFDTYTVGSSVNPKKTEVRIEKDRLVREVLKDSRYLKIVDVEAHLNDGVELDWTNAAF